MELQAGEGALTGTSIALVKPVPDEAATAPSARSSGDEATGDMRTRCRPSGGAKQVPISSEQSVQVGCTESWCVREVHELFRSEMSMNTIGTAGGEGSCGI